MFGRLSKILSKRRRTALVVIQPQTLLQKDADSAGFLFGSPKQRSFEDFVSKIRERRKYVVYLGYSNLLWWKLVGLSDLLFIFLDEYNRFQKLEKGREQRPLSTSERKYLGRRKPYIPGSGAPGDYLSIAEELERIFSRRGITRILVCGGWDNKCVKLLLVKLNERLPKLHIFVSSRFLAREGTLESFRETMEYKGVPIVFETGAENTLLKLF